MNQTGSRGNKIHILLPEKKALAGLLTVKPTEDMPRRTQATKAERKRKQAKSLWGSALFYNFK